MRRRAVLLLGLCAIAFGCGRFGCGEADHLAELASYSGQVERDLAAERERWRPARGGERFRVGDGLRTGRGARAELRLLPHGEVTVDGDTVVRFAAAPPGEAAARVDVDIGSIEVGAAGSELTLDTVLGLVRIDRNSRVRVRAQDDRERLEVMLGRVSVDRNGKRTQAEAGEELLLDVGGIVLSAARAVPPQPAQPLEAAPPPVLGGDASVSTAPDAGDVDAGGAAEPEDDEPLPSGALPADVVIAASESAIIHDPAPPTRVRIPFTGCERGGVLEVARRSGRSFAKLRAREAGVVRLPPGHYRYRVRCLPDRPRGKPIAEGSLRVDRDAGRRQLPRRAPAVTVDADGRRYTVRYQNRVPQISLRWPEPPPSERYDFELTTPSGEKKQQSLALPAQRFASGALHEGIHEFRFATPDGKHVAQGSVRIDFDNAATTAYLSSPADGTIAPGRPITVSGAALSRSVVRVGATEVPLDAQGRFSTAITPDSGQDAIAIRVQHPETGVHYYLRRVAGARAR